MQQRAKPKAPKPLRKVTVVVPAYNEEEHIGGMLASLKSWRKGHPDKRNIKLLVVNDGSTDKTAQIAEREGVEVIHSDPKDPRHNMGKADAVRVGALRARDVHKSDILVMLDADLKEPEGRAIDEMIKPVADREYQMTVAQTGEGVSVSRSESGNRAIYLPVLNPWLNGHPKWAPVKGYGLEEGLNKLIRLDKQYFFKSTMFSAEGPFRKVWQGKNQSAEVWWTRRHLDDRVYPANKAKELVAQKKYKEA